jgi:transposase-like protein
MGQIVYLVMENQFKSFIEVLDYFKEESTCVNYLAQTRWGNSPCCPHCGNVGAYITNRGFKCKAKECHKKFSVTTKTIYENSKIPLRLWFAAMYILTSHKKGISSHQLSRDLNVTQKTAWFMNQRIREMLNQDSSENLNGDIEVDETFVGGKNKNRHAHKKIEGSQGRSAKDKTPVFGITQKNEVKFIERPHKVIPNKIVKEKIITKQSQVKCIVVNDTEGLTLQTIISENVDKGSTIVSDSYKSYNGLELTYNHIKIKHTEGNYKTEGQNHTNTIEGYWTLLKRSYVGTYHYMSPKHLQRYCDELSYRYNSRELKDTVRFVKAVSMSDNGRITYKQLIQKK